MKSTTIKIGKEIKKKFSSHPGLLNISINHETGCHEWQGAKNSAGYGYVKIDHKVFRVHRLTYAIKNGAINPEQVIMHMCDNRICCNPDHLAAGSQKANMRDMISKNRAGWQKEVLIEV